MSRRLALALAPLGVLLGHSLGFLAAHPAGEAHGRALADHTHLPLLVVVAAPVALAAAVRLVDRGRVDVARLALVQVLGFVALETAERIGDGWQAVVAEPGLWLGLLAQVVVARALAGALHLVARLVPTPTTVDAITATSALPPVRPSTFTVRCRPSPLSRRGPPALLAAA